MIILCTLISLYLIALFLRIVMSWFPGTDEGGLGSVYSFLTTVTEPVLGPLRAVLPPVRIGGAGLDLSPIVVAFGGIILRGLLCA